MSTVAFIGLGIMGAPMARNLVGAGFDVVGFNRSPAATRHLVDAGGRAADSVSGAVADADIVATMLPDTPDVTAVLTGPDGVFRNARKGALVVDFSTIKPEASAQLAADGAAVGLRVLDAPVSGGQQGAIDGTLSIMVGGDVADFDSARSLFEPLSGTVVHVGASGSGQIVKAANQLIVAGTLGLVAEALAFLDAHGVDAERALSVLRGGLAGSAVLERKAGQMHRKDFTPGFRAELHLKDMTIFTDAARSVGVTTLLGALATQQLGAVVARGDGALDHSAVYKLVTELSGR